MATITITIADGKLSSIANDLDNVFDRPEGVGDLAFIREIITKQLRILRVQGRRRKVANAVNLDDNDLVSE